MEKIPDSFLSRVLSLCLSVCVLAIVHLLVSLSYRKRNIKHHCPCRQAVPSSTTLPTPAVQGKCSTVSPLNYHWQHSISMKCNIRAPLYCTCFVAPLVHFPCFNTTYNYCSVLSVWNKAKRRGHSGKCKCCISLFPRMRPSRPLMSVGSAGEAQH